jgi:hypothetical protein
MSADKRRTILIGFAGLAVVLLAVIVIVSPSFRSEDASGAIGAVQKHRAPQITKADVILGDEQTRNEQKVRYVDYLNDASALRNLSADFAAASKSQAKTNYEAAQLAVKARNQDVLHRFVMDIDSVAVGMRKLAETDANAFGNKKAAILAEVDSLAAKARNKTLADQEIQSLSARLANLAQQIRGSEAALESQKLREADVNLGHAIAALDQKNAAAVKSNLAAAGAALDAHSNLAAMLRSEIEYAQSMAKESKVLAEAESTLANMALRSEAQDTLGLIIVVCDQARDLEQRAVANMKSNLASETDAVSALGKMTESLQSFDRGVASHSALYDAEALGSFKRNVADLSSKIANRSAEANAQATADMRSQLYAIGNSLQHADTLDAKIANEDAAVQSMLRAQVENQATYDSFKRQVSTLGSIAENRQYASMMRGSEDFATQAHALMSKGMLNAQKKATASLDNQKK